MRWPTFVVVAVFLLTLQAGVAPVFEIRGVRPDWLLVGVVFFALYARSSDAILAAWILGLCADLMTVERPGLISLSFALAAAVVVALREYLFRYWATTQFFVTLAIALLLQTVLLVYRRMMYPATLPLWADWLTFAGLSALYTAAWAPIMHKALLRLSRLLGIARPRYSHAGLRSMEMADV